MLSLLTEQETTDSQVVAIAVQTKAVHFSHGQINFSLRRTKGLEVLLELWKHPYQAIDAVELSVILNGKTVLHNTKYPYDFQLSLSTGFDAESAIPCADGIAVHQVRLRLINLIQDKAELEAAHDLSRKEEIDDEIDKLTCYLKEVLTRDNHLANFPSQATKLNEAVYRSVHYVIKQIAVHDEKLAKMIRQTVSYWGNLVYQPCDGIDLQINYCSPNAGGLSN